MDDPSVDVAPLPSLDELAKRADKGDESALTDLLNRCEADPKALIRAGEGDLPKTLIQMLTHEMLQDYPAMECAVHARCREIQREAEGPTPTPLEALLAQRVALTWLELYLMEMWITSPYGGEKGSLKVRQFKELQRDRADRRYIRAIKTLASVRKMKLPNVNLFVGNTQNLTNLNQSIAG